MDELKRRIRKSEEATRLSLLANAIGDRRYRDLSDMLFQLEIEVGWDEAISYLLRVRDENYTIPAGIGPTEIAIEPLKYREGVFAFLSCQAMEPIPITTSEIIEVASESSSYSESVGRISEVTSRAAQSQIDSGDTLFYNPDDLVEFGNLDLLSSFHRKNLEYLRAASIQECAGRFYIGALWMNGLGLRALLEVGITGMTTDSDSLNTVLSVIQSWTDVQPSVKSVSSMEVIELIYPSNKDYRTLLRGLIHQDSNILKTQGSRQSIPIANRILSDIVSQYLDSESSHDFKGLLDAMILHVRVRSIQSISLLEELANNSSQRIATSAIIALANFYHESAASALASLLCRTKDSDILQVTTNALLNMSRRLPEIVPVLKSIHDSTCDNPQRIRKILRQIPSSSDKYNL